MERARGDNVALVLVAVLVMLAVIFPALALHGAHGVRPGHTTTTVVTDR